MASMRENLRQNTGAIEVFRAHVGHGQRIAPFLLQDFRSDALLAMGRRAVLSTGDRFRFCFAPVTVKEISVMTKRKFNWCSGALN